MNNKYLDKVWKENPEYIRQFYDNSLKYKKLCSEVEYIIRTKISNHVETASITSRAKTLKSFCEKISRKKYEAPFSQITDFSGVRLVHLYISDKQKIEELIEQEFEILEKTDKISSENSDTFGYGALHYLVKVKEENHSGARYDDLRNLVCELQIRTILQDAWAVVAHHLSYKQESDIPFPLRRKLNALSGLFETADDQFESIRTTRDNYQEKVENSISKPDNNAILKEPLNLDNLIVFLEWKYPKRDKDNLDSVSPLLDELKKEGYKNLFQLNKYLDKTKECFQKHEIENPPGLDADQYFTAVGVVRISIKHC